MIEWTEAAFGTGVPDIDAEHRRLFEQVNALLSARDAGASEHAVRVLLAFLTQYVVTHFVHEERWMADHGCPGQNENRAGHTRFVERLETFKDRMRAEGATAGLMKDLSQFLTEWLTSHVEHVDVANLRQAAS